MEGTIVNFRKSTHRQTTNQMVVLVADDREKALKFVGKTAVWTSKTKKEIKGKVTNVHGRKGAVRVLFERGMPGQSVGTKIKIE